MINAHHKVQLLLGVPLDFDLKLALDKSQRVTKVITVHPEGTMNV